jgi:ABC-type glycerol-3-phosphate transport system substrate-binding protein
VEKSFKALTIFFLLFGFSGCSAAGDPHSDTLTIWHCLSDREDAFQELAKKYEEATQTNVKFELYAPSEAYSQRVKASAQTSTLPDIFGILGEKRDFASFIQAGHVADLTEALGRADAGSDWVGHFFAKALAVNEFVAENEYGIKPGVYGVPLDVTTIQMVYNKRLYREAGLDPDAPPQTWEQFLDHCKAKRKKRCLISQEQQQPCP